MDKLQIYKKDMQVSHVSYLLDLHRTRENLVCHTWKIFESFSRRMCESHLQEIES